MTSHLDQAHEKKLCSSIGDALLTVENNDTFFIGGMLAFGIAHAFYALGFDKGHPRPHDRATNNDDEEMPIGFFLFPLTLVVLASAGSQWVPCLWKNRRDLVVPVCAYVIGEAEVFSDSQIRYFCRLFAFFVRL